MRKYGPRIRKKKLIEIANEEALPDLKLAVPIMLTELK